MDDPHSPEACANCGAQRMGEYCYRCGQHFLERLSIRLSPEQRIVYADAHVGVYQQTSYVSLALCVPFALLLRALFRRSGITVADALVFSLFALGQIALVEAIINPRLYRIAGSIETAGWVGYIPYVVILGQAAAGFFGSPLRSIVKVNVRLHRRHAALERARERRNPDVRPPVPLNARRMRRRRIQMRRAYFVLSLAIITLGAVHIAATPRYFTQVTSGAVWFATGGFAIVLTGALNLLRRAYGEIAPGLRLVCVAANVVMTGVALLAGYVGNASAVEYVVIVGIVGGASVLSMVPAAQRQVRTGPGIASASRL